MCRQMGFPGISHCVGYIANSSSFWNSNQLCLCYCLRSSIWSFRTGRLSFWRSSLWSCFGHCRSLADCCCRSGGFPTGFECDTPGESWSVRQSVWARIQTRQGARSWEMMEDTGCCWPWCLHVQLQQLQRCQLHLRPIWLSAKCCLKASTWSWFSRGSRHRSMVFRCRPAYVRYSRLADICSY